MSVTFLVRLADGTYVRKAEQDLQDDDVMVFDGPGAFAEVEAHKAEFAAEIEAAGGLEAWRAIVKVSQY